MAIGKSMGVIPSMEFLGFVDGIKNVASAWAIAKGTGDPQATVVADVFHMIRGGGSVDDLLQLPGDRLANFHINDVPAEPDPLDPDRLRPRDGRRGHRRPAEGDRQPPDHRLPRPALARALQPRPLGVPTRRRSSSAGSSGCGAWWKA